ncbi:MAG: septal ring lytic transglycosylase RlpA family protein [Hydrogenophaga sp.]
MRAAGVTALCLSVLLVAACTGSGPLAPGGAVAPVPAHIGRDVPALTLTGAEPPAPLSAPPVLPPTAFTANEPVPVDEAVLGKGLASWYGRRFQGRRTASGEPYDRRAFTAAHRTLPMGTRVRVRSVATGQMVVVRINDRGPARPTRIIDLSEAAIEALGVRHRGVTAVELFAE